MRRKKGGISRRGGVCECPEDRSHGVTRVLRSRFRHIPPWGMSRSDRGSESPFARTKKADPEKGGISRRGGVCECPKDRSHGATRVLRSR
ncbi:MAG: hypothetical protein J5508_05900, partial [Bacteroidales bacterium]|nr:hypothetical protein [Bacteroidales bacterium]